MWIALGLLGLVLVLLLVVGDQGAVAGLDADTFGNTAYFVGLIALLAAGYWQTFRADLGRSLRALAIWGLLGLTLVIAYAYRERAQRIGGDLIGALRPGTAVTGADGEVTVTRRSDGAFSVLAEVNGRAEQRFLFDTGASAVVLTAENAAALGIRPEPNAFQRRVSTANGTTTAAPVLIDSIRVGPITERRVEALVSRPGDLSGNLLGTSFLDRLPSYEVRGDTLLLRSR